MQNEFSTCSVTIPSLVYLSDVVPVKASLVLTLVSFGEVTLPETSSMYAMYNGTWWCEMGCLVQFRYHPVYVLLRVYGTKCQACKEGLCPEDLVRKTVSGVYHVKCFSCSVCNRQLETGEQMYLVQVRRGRGEARRQLHRWWWC